jgi:hypothetical protein
MPDAAKQFLQSIWSRRCLNKVVVNIGGSLLGDTVPAPWVAFKLVSSQTSSWGNSRVADIPCICRLNLGLSLRDQGYDWSVRFGDHLVRGASKILSISDKIMQRTLQLVANFSASSKAPSSLS